MIKELRSLIKEEREELLFENREDYQVLQKYFKQYLDLIGDSYKWEDGRLIVEYHTCDSKGFEHTFPYWNIRHKGYLNSFEVSGKNLKETIGKAVDEVKKLIEKEKKWRNEND